MESVAMVENSDYAACWQRWSQPVVRDLAWVLASPPLLAMRAPGVRWLNAAWCERAYRVSHDWLAALDHNPTPLTAMLAQRSDPRLGSYFEALLAFWLAWENNPLYRLVGRNLPVRAKNLTLGELDFLVEERQSGELQHWEVAVKFYLGVAPGGELRQWVGPGLKDRLDMKVQRLLEHQLALTQRPEGRGLMQHLGLGNPQPVCLLKGRLFYPPDAGAEWAPHSAAASHLTGWWMPQADFLQHYASAGLHWIRLPKEHWLTEVAPPVRIGDAQTAQALVETLVQTADNRAAAVIGLHQDADGQYRETTRGFVTPSGWPQ
ncbi:MAG: DUF1853 family protein [Moraxellaceae bacterium]